MAMQTLYNPKNHRLMADINGMFIGKSIHINGTARKNASKFAINLFCGDDYDYGDIALHFNVRFIPVEEVVRNSVITGGWGKEERSIPFFKFGKESEFRVTITCTATGYELSCNEHKNYVFFNHRIPFERVTHVNVEEDCDIYSISGGPEGTPLTWRVPFESMERRSILIRGTPKGSDEGFDISLLDEEETKTCLNMSVRMDSQTIVRNTYNGGWGTGERSLGIGFPFKQGVEFEIKISVYRRNLEVFVDGLFAFTFARTWHEGDIKKVKVENDVEIEHLSFSS